MSTGYPYCGAIDLHVAGRISREDAARQERTAREILDRLARQPGVILADEVGMGKTFVSLAVAVSVALADKEDRPVVVMVPPSLKEKWPRDLNLFLEKCLPPAQSDRIKCGVAERTVQFLKLLDDPPERRKKIIFLTHGAMSRGLRDRWVKLALIQRALHRKRDTERLKRALYRSLSGLLGVTEVDRRCPGLWADLLGTNTRHWLRVMKRHGLPPEDGDDPVPEAARQALAELDASEVYEALQAIPRRKSGGYHERLKNARRAISRVMRTVWRECIRSVDIKLPLLILDEAHHLKNARTRLSSLFQVDEAKADVEEISRGPLGGVFERMLFLTATPFQLGHHELCSVLERLAGISWAGDHAPPLCENAYREQIRKLHEALNGAQEAGVRLDAAWGALRPDDLTVAGERYHRADDWWAAARSGGDLTSAARHAMARFDQAGEALKGAEALLRPWVIRHQRARMLPEPYRDTLRRRRLPGAAINGNLPGRERRARERGIALHGESLLPFLLAARATALKPEARPVFAEGLASSYEAFLYTRARGEATASDASDEPLTDQDDASCHPHAEDDESRWYLDNLESVVHAGSLRGSAAHPKVAATVGRALALWEKGEKVLIFCHYIATGRVLRQHLSDAIRNRIADLAARALGCPEAESHQALERAGERFYDEGALIRKTCDAEVAAILSGYPSLADGADILIDVVRRFLRTPSFLVRFFPLSEGDLTAEAVTRAFEARDASGVTVSKLLRDFFDFLENRCGIAERAGYIEAINRLQTGSHRTVDVAQTFSEDEAQGVSAEILPNVRLVNGSTKQETRQRLMLAFNTPFYPEVLIASSVLAEGVDLHLNCRNVIHHDLSWNPSTLEQRTGRVDRIGAKVERCGVSIDLYFPFIAETQDEKMYRVVMDRERWFSVVMGEKYVMDAISAEQLAERVPLPEAAAEALRFRLEVGAG